jgi:arsenite methyltransferase
MYAGCVAGAIQKDEYLRLIEDSGFMGVRIRKEKKIIIPDDILSKYLAEDEIIVYKESGAGIYSITVYAEISCCGPDAVTCFKVC